MNKGKEGLEPCILDLQSKCRTCLRLYPCSNWIVLFIKRFNLNNKKIYAIFLILVMNKLVIKLFKGV